MRKRCLGRKIIGQLERRRQIYSLVPWLLSLLPCQIRKLNSWSSIVPTLNSWLKLTAPFSKVLGAYTVDTKRNDGWTMRVAITEAARRSKQLLLTLEQLAQNVGTCRYWIWLFIRPHAASAPIATRLRRTPQRQQLLWLLASEARLPLL